MAVTDVAIETIKQMLVSGELQPGQRLPPEKELSERLGLSRNSLREAVKSLDLIGVLDVRRGDGTYVTSLEPRLLLEALAFVVDLQCDDSVLEVLEVRRVLEPFAARLAAALITDEQLDALEADIEGLPERPAVDELVEHDTRFHSAITHASGNSYLDSLLGSLTSATIRARAWRGITQEGVTDRTLAEHRAILAALRRRDGDLVMALLTVHIAGVEAWLRRAVAPGEATAQ